MKLELCQNEGITYCSCLKEYMPCHVHATNIYEIKMWRASSREVWPIPPALAHTAEEVLNQGTVVRLSSLAQRVHRSTLLDLVTELNSIATFFNFMYVLHNVLFP